MVYPLNLFMPDKLNGGPRPSVIFSAKQVKSNVNKSKSQADELTTMKPKGGFALPFPNDGLVDSVSNEYNNASSLVAGMANEAAMGITPGGENTMSQLLGMVPDPKYTQVYMGTQPRTWSGTGN